MEDRLDADMWSVLCAATLTAMFCMNTVESFAKGYTEIAQNPNNPTVGSVSWGLYEDGWTKQGEDLMEDSLAIARARGINLFADR